MVRSIEGVHVVANTVKVPGTTEGTSLEWQKLPNSIKIEFNVFVKFRLLIVANVIPGVALPMLTPLVSMIQPF